MIFGCGPEKLVDGQSTLIEAIFRKFKRIASRVDGFLVLPGDFVLQRDTNIEIVCKLNHHLRLRHAAVVPTSRISINASSDAATAYALAA